MKRDMDLVRLILKAIEEIPAGRIANGLKLDGQDDREIGEYLRLLIDSGFIDGQSKRTYQGPYLISIRGLTWSGHDFVESAASDSVWKTVKGKVVKNLGTVSFDVFLELLKAEAKRRMGLLG